MVSLPGGQQRVLDGIESDLEGGEPRLRSMFAIFTRLTRDEEAPSAESLRPRRRHIRWTPPGSGLAGAVRLVLLIPVTVGLLALLAFVMVNGSAGHGCEVAAGPHAAAVPVRGCQPAPDWHGRL